MTERVLHLQIRREVLLGSAAWPHWPQKWSERVGGIYTFCGVYLQSHRLAEEGITGRALVDVHQICCSIFDLLRTCVDPDEYSDIKVYAH